MVDHSHTAAALVPFVHDREILPVDKVTQAIGTTEDSASISMSRESECVPVRVQERRERTCW